jgi:hypothetical protein
MIEGSVYMSARHQDGVSPCWASLKPAPLSLVLDMGRAVMGPFPLARAIMVLVGLSLLRLRVNIAHLPGFP